MNRLELAPVGGLLRSVEYEGDTLRTGVVVRAHILGGVISVTNDANRLLKPRESRAYILGALGETVTRTASAIGIDDKTVKSYRAECRRSINAHNSADAIRILFSSGDFGVEVPITDISISEPVLKAQRFIRGAAHGETIEEMSEYLPYSVDSIKDRFRGLYQKTGIPNIMAAVTVAHLCEIDRDIR